MQQHSAALSSVLSHSDGFATLANLYHDAAVFVVDADRTVVFWSEGAERLLGFKATDVVGQNCLKANRCDQCMRGCPVTELETVRDLPLELFDANGQRVKVRKTAHALFDQEGKLAGSIEVLAPDTRRERSVTRKAKKHAVKFHGLLSADPKMQQIFQTVRNVAETEATALVRGESGSGKELVARAIHKESRRKGGPFVAVNCAALTPTLLESELFGHTKGAFTGAVKNRVGLFQQADKGTLFLDEVAELPLELQAKLLRVIAERELVPVGATNPVHVDVRVVAATHRSLREAVKAGRFREDLMYRLRVVPIFIPPLRERIADVELLLWQLIEEHNREDQRRVDAVSPDAMRALLDHDWPGNVRELRNVVAYAFAVSRTTRIEMDELPPEFRESRRHAMPAVNPEVERIRDAIDAAQGNIGRAAQALGISRPTLWRKRKKYGL